MQQARSKLNDQNDGPWLGQPLRPATPEAVECRPPLEMSPTGPFAQFEAQIVFLAQQCCGERSTISDFLRVARSLEDTPLLQDDHEGATGPLDAPNVIVLAPADGCISHPANSSQPPNTVVVMRHGHRVDEDDETWAMTAARPWDPPLTNLGRQQAQEAGQSLQALQPTLQIEYVITSPFLRCLQTSAEVVQALKLPQGRWLVDWSMGEIAEPRLLVGGRPDMEEKLEGRPIETWMWGGASGSEALQQWAQSEPTLQSSPTATTPVMLSRPAPPYPETRESAMGRYEDELTLLAEGARGLLRGNCLVVTHGEAVRCAVNMLVPEVTVYEVRHCSHVQLSRPPSAPQEDRDGDGGGKTNNRGGKQQRLVSLRDRGWRLETVSGETGVSWFA